MPFFLPGVFSFLSELFNDAVFVKRDSMCMVKQAFRLYSHSFVKKQNKNIKSREATNTSLEDPTGLLCTNQDSDRWTDECSFAFTSCTDDRCLCVSFCNTNSILHSLFPGPFTVGGQPCVASMPEPGFYLKGHQVLLLSKCHCRIRAD